MQLEAATGTPIDELLFGERQAASDSADSRPKDSHVLRRLEKKAREIERLQQQASNGRALSAEERTKVGELLALQGQIALLKQPTPGTTPAQTPGSTQTPSSELSGASTQIGAAACFASDYASAQAKAKSLLISPPTRAPTRHMPAEVQQQLADERAGRELARQVARQEAREAEQATWQLLRAPFDSWDDQALWQLAMCEFALEHIADVASSPKQLQLDFRAETSWSNETPKLLIHRTRVDITTNRIPITNTLIRLPEPQCQGTEGAPVAPPAQHPPSDAQPALAITSLCPIPARRRARQSSCNSSLLRRDLRL